MKNRNLLLLLALASMWGPSFLFIKIAVDSYPPLTLVAVRLSSAAILLYLLLRLRGQQLPRDRATWGRFVFMGFFANALPFTLFSIGEQFADSGAAAILNGTTPIFTMIFAHWLIAEERLSIQRILGVAVGFLGVLLIFLEEFQALVAGAGLHSSFETLGLLMFIGAACCYGISITYGRKYLRGLPPLVGPSSQLIAASILMIPIAFLVERPSDLAPTWQATTSLLILGFWGTALAYLVFYQLVETASATYLSMVTYLLITMPVWYYSRPQ